MRHLCDARTQLQDLFIAIFRGGGYFVSAVELLTHLTSPSLSLSLLALGSIHSVVDSSALSRFVLNARDTSRYSRARIITILASREYEILEDETGGDDGYRGATFPPR